MKNKIIYSCEWKRNIETSWSGTNMSIRKRLDKDFEVIDFDYGIRKPYTFLSKAINKILHKKIDLSKHYTKVFKNKYKFNNFIFQFSSTPNIYDKSNKHFIYQDLTMNYVKDLYYNNKNIFSISGFNRIDEKDINKLNEKENEFYNHDNVYCMTMGRWLAKYLIDEVHIQSNRVCFVGGGTNIDISKIDMSKKTGNKFLFVGKDFKRKNGPLVIEAFKKLHKENSNYELYVAGPNNLDINEDGIHNLGLLSFNELIEYFNLCDVFVMPSVFEAYGIVFGEALSFGLPIIGRDAYEMRYFVEEGKNGYLLKDNTSDSLANIMKKTIENKDIINYVKDHHEEYIKQYSWDTVVERMTNFINSKCK